MTISRRGLLTGLAAGLAAPAIVRVDNIMPVRNRLIVPTSQLYDGPPTVYSFSCFVKGADGEMPVMLPSDRVQSISDAGGGWYRYSTEISGTGELIHLPAPNMWGAQVEWRGPPSPGFDLTLTNPAGDGVLIMPKLR